MPDEGLTEVEGWFKEIDQSLKHEDIFRKRGDNIIDRYRNDDRLSHNENNAFQQSRYNVLYSNTQTAHPLLFSRLPEPVIRKRNLITTSKIKDEAQKKQVDKDIKAVCEVIERAISYSTDENNAFDEFDDGVDDYQLPGRGLVKISIRPVIEQKEVREEVEGELIEPANEFQEAVFEAPEGAIEEEGRFFQVSTDETVVFQEGVIEYWNWDDWTTNEARRWNDVTWLAFRSLLTEEAVKDEFGAKVAKEVTYDAELDPENRRKTTTDEKLAEFWEVWDKNELKVITITRTIDEPVRESDDPLGLAGFFPCAKPLFSITTNNTTIPVPFFEQYQDQAIEIDSLTDRISVLTDNLRYRYLYDASIKELASLNDAGDGDGIPVEDFARFAEKGGLQTVLAFMPLQEITETIVALESERERRLEIVRDIEGIPDIMRGVSDPREAAETNRIKGNFGTLRISHRQRQIQRWIRDTYQILGEAIIENIPADILEVMTGVEITPTMELLMKNQQPRTFAIDIETDSTIVADEVMEQERLREMIGAIVEFGGISEQLVNQAGATFTKDLFSAVFGSFKEGRMLEDSLEQSLAELAEEQANAQPPPDPELIKAENESQKIQLDAQKAQIDAQLKAAELNIEQQKVDLEAGKALDSSASKKTDQLLKFQDIQLDRDKLALEAVDPSKNIVAEG